jgi:hypothetical protein
LDTRARRRVLPGNALRGILYLCTYLFLVRGMDEVRIPLAALKGRGAASRLAHRFERDTRGAFDDGWSTLDEKVDASREALRTEVIWEQAHSIITGNDSPDVYFDRSINPYRGCEHGCIYCYARPTHSYLNMSPGLDFETKIIAKQNIAAVLRRSPEADRDRHRDRLLPADRARTAPHARRHRADA